MATIKIVSYGKLCLISEGSDEKKQMHSNGKIGKDKDRALFMRWYYYTGTLSGKFRELIY